MEGPLAPGAPNGNLRTPSPTTPAIDPQLLVDYLEKVLDVNLGATEQDLRAPGSLLSPAKLQDTLQRAFPLIRVPVVGPSDLAVLAAHRPHWKFQQRTRR